MGGERRCAGARLPVDGQVAELRQQLLQPQRRTLRDLPLERPRQRRPGLPGEVRGPRQRHADVRAQSEAEAARLEGDRVGVQLPPAARSRRRERRAAGSRERPRRGRRRSGRDAGPARAPSRAVGSASSCAYGRAGNQLTRTGAGSRSQERAAAETTIAPALSEPVAITPTGTTARGAIDRTAPPNETRLTGASKATVTGAPSFTCSQWPSKCARGVSTVNVRRSLRPTSHPAQPGRRTVTSTVMRSPLSSLCNGQT